MCSFLLLQDAGGGSCAATPTKCGRWESSLWMWEVGVVLPLQRGWRWESSLSRCGRWELCCLSDEVWEVGVALPLRRGWRWESSFQMWKVGVLSPDVGGGSCAATPTRLEVGVPQSNYKTTQHKLMFQSARFPERVLNFQLHNFSGHLLRQVTPNAL